MKRRWKNRPLGLKDRIRRARRNLELAQSLVRLYPYPEFWIRVIKAQDRYVKLVNLVGRPIG